jgi:hypothetical protein
MFACLHLVVDYILQKMEQYHGHHCFNHAHTSISKVAVFSCSYYLVKVFLKKKSEETCQACVI